MLQSNIEITIFPCEQLDFKKQPKKTAIKIVWMTGFGPADHPDLSQDTLTDHKWKKQPEQTDCPSSVGVTGFELPSFLAILGGF